MMNNQDDRQVKLSIITPVYSGEEYLLELVEQIESLRCLILASPSCLILYEAIFVIDGANDNSERILEGLSQKFDWLKVITLSRNFGQHSATIAGILHSSGDWLATIDEDLQHNPKDIIKLLKEAILNGCDVVYARPIADVHQKFIRDLGSKYYKLTLSYLTGNKNLRLFNSYRLIRGSIARASASSCSYDTYFDVAITWFTQRISSVSMDLRDVRMIEENRSGYNLRKLVSHARKMAFTGDIKVLRLNGLIGIICLMLSFLGIASIVFLRLFIPNLIAVKGWPSIVILILFFGGLGSIMLSIISEYLMKIMMHIHGKPAYFVVDRSRDRLLMPMFVQQ